MTQTYDAIVIGAGVMGASIAFHLAERGLKVAILERKVTASGATGHSSGLVRMHYDLAAESELTFTSYKHLFQQLEGTRRRRMWIYANGLHADRQA